MATELDKLLIKISADVSELTKATNLATKEIGKIAQATEKTAEATAKSTSKITKAFEMLKFEKVIDGIEKVAGAIQKLGSFVLDFGAFATETQNLFDVAFGEEMSAKATGFVERLSNAFGVNETMLKNVMARYYMLSESMGLTSKQAYTVAQDMTFLGKELSSLYNVSESVAWKKIASGLAGQVQPLNEWGISVRIASLEETALKYGIEGKISAMTEAQKVQLRYLTIMDATTKAQGDSQRTINDLANSWRRIKNEMYTVAESVAKALVPVFEALLPPIQMVIDAISILAQTFINFVNMFTGGSKEQARSNEAVAKSAKAVEESGGGAVPASAIRSVQQLGDAQKKTAKATEEATKISENQLFKFDELNQLKKETVTDSGAGGGGAGGGAGGGGAGGGGAGAGGAPEFDLIGEPKLDVSGITDGFDKITESANALTEVLLDLFSPFKEAWDKYGQRVIDAFKEAMEAIKPIIEAVGDAMLFIWDNGGKQLLQGLSELGLVLLELALKLIKPVIDGLGTLAEIFAPILSLAISTVLEIIGWLVDKLVDLIDWINQNETAMQIIQGTIEALTVFVGLLAGAIGIIIGVFFAWNAICTVWYGTGTLLTGAIALLTSPFAPLVVAIMGAIAVGVLIWKNWDELKIQAQELWQKLKEVGANIVDAFSKYFGEWKETIAKWIENVKEWGYNMVNSFFQTLNDVYNFILKFIYNSLVSFVEFVRSAKETFNNMKEAIVGVFKAIVEKIKTYLEEWKTTLINGWNYIKEKFIKPISDGFNSIKTKVVEVFNNMKTSLSEVLSYIKTTFTNAWSSAWGKIKDIFSSAWGALKDVVKAPLNGVISMLNKAIGLINKFSLTIPDWVPVIGGKKFGFNMSTIPMLASGGIVQQATLAMIGEQGNEAVLPLENSGVMDRLGAIIANSIVGAMNMNTPTTRTTEQPTTVIMELDSIQFGKAIISSINREKRRTGVKINGVY